MKRRVHISRYPDVTPTPYCGRRNVLYKHTQYADPVGSTEAHLRNLLRMSNLCARCRERFLKAVDPLTLLVISDL